MDQVLLEELCSYVADATHQFAPLHFAQVLQEDLIHILDPQVLVDIQPWVEEVLAMHFCNQRQPRCPEEPGRAGQKPVATREGCGTS